MNISELDEAQGLTAEMVRDFLKGRGFQVEDGIWRNPAVKRLAYADVESSPLHCESNLRALKCDGGFNSQEMLREMNPRLRLGVPSLRARVAHALAGGLWMASRKSHPGGPGSLPNTILFVCFPFAGYAPFDGMAAWTADAWMHVSCGDQLEGKCASWKFWPVDQNGNKVRWPVGPEGML